MPQLKDGRTYDIVVPDFYDDASDMMKIQVAGIDQDLASLGLHWLKRDYMSPEDPNLQKFRDSLAQELQDPRLYRRVAKLDDGVIIGAHEAYIANEGRPFHLSDGLNIAQDFQGMGVGTALFDHFEATVSTTDSPQVRVPVHIGNERARKFVLGRDYVPLPNGIIVVDGLKVEMFVKDVRGRHEIPGRTAS